MKFRIERTSDCRNEASPCEGAYIDAKGNGWKVYKWAIDINSLEDLMKLTENEGDIIVSAPNEKTDNHPSIEIYDDYRE